MTLEELCFNLLDTMSEISKNKKENNFSKELLKLKNGLVKY